MAKILVVDDDEDIRLLYSHELKEAGYEVVTVENGCKLLEKIDEAKPDLAILDIKMTDQNALDIFDNIKTHYSDLPVILSSVYNMITENTESTVAEFYVEKSFDLTELKVKVTKAIQKKQCR